MNFTGLAAAAALAIVWPFNNTFRCHNEQMKSLFLTVCFLLVALSVQAVDRDWNGSVSTNWNVAANWTPAGVPVAGDVLDIPSGPANQPVIFSGTMAKAARVTMYFGSSLTINSGGELELASALTNAALGNLGTVTNNGTLRIKSGFHGIDNGNNAVFINNGTILLGETTSSPYAFIEEGIRLSAPGGTANFTNNSTGSITIRRPGNNGILLFQGNVSFSNHGQITVQEAGLNPDTEDTADGIDTRNGTFVNETSGVINISKIKASGLNCRSSGSMTNKGSITISEVGLTTQQTIRDGLNNTATFTNTSTGTLTIDKAGNNGILNQGVIHNSGQILIGTLYANSITNLGMGNLAGFNNYNGAVVTIKNAKIGIISGGLGGLLTNYAGATINIAQIAEDGLYQFGIGGTDNRGDLNIGRTGSIGRFGINNACQFINQFGATLVIVSCANSAIVNDTLAGISGSIQNVGRIIVNNASNVGGHAINNKATGTIENKTCVSLIHITSDNTISNTGTFTNEGNIIENGSGNSSITDNSGTVQNLNGGTFSITGSNTGLNSTATGAIWTGCDDTNWAEVLNWNDLTIPVASDNVLIPDRLNDPTIFGGTAAVGKSVTIENNAILTLNASSNLTISGATSTGLHNKGTVNNAGVLSISNTGGAGLHNDGGPFNNNSGGELRINSTTNDALYLSKASFNNFAKLNIGNTGSIGIDGIVVNGGSLDNKTSGEITIDRTTRDGIYLFSSFMINAGKITIGSTAAIGVNGITNGSAITNNTGGEIKIDRAALGIYNSFAGFTNKGSLKIGSVANITGSGISNQNANFNNDTTGMISIDRTGGSGIYVYYGANSFRSFQNSGKVNIGKTAAVGGSGIENGATFNNNPIGEITIDRTANSGISVFDDNDSNTQPAVFNNAGKLTLGGIATLGGNGIQNRVTFNNNAGGQILIDRSASDGLFNAGGTFNNAGKLDIGATSAPSGDGLENAATFNNQACGEIRLFDNLKNDGTFTNTGLLRMNTALAHTNSGTFTNNGIIEYPQGSLIPNVTNNDVIVKAVSGECPVANALDIGGSNSFTIGSTWYKNANLTNAAGTYNQTANAFTASSLAYGSTTTLYFTVSDDANTCTRNLSINLTYNDLTPPTIQCPANQTVAANSNCGGVVGTWSLVSKSDNCVSGSSITESQMPAGTTPLNGHNDSETVTFTATDGNSNSTTCSFTVTLKDVTRPSITCPPNATVNANASCQSTVGSYGAATVSDNCNPSPVVTQSPVSTTILTGHNATQMVTLTANDGNGNTNTCTLVVTLKDITPPGISCPPSVTLNANASCQGQVGSYDAVTLSDNCNPTPTVTQSPSASTTLTGHNSAQTITLTANDGNGNTNTCTLTVTLKDVSAPGITCPADRTVNTDTDQCSSIQTYTVTATDNCTYSLTRTNGLASGSAFLLGYNAVNWQVTDAGGNSSACSFSITVVDNQLPTISCPVDRTVNTDAGLCSSIQTYTVTASDNCSYTLTRTNGLASGSDFPLGYNVVNWQVTDAGGNSAVCSFSITLTDNQAPTITCPASSTLSATTGLCAAVVNYTVSGSDNCSGWSLSRTSGLQSGAQFPVGTTTVIWKNTDTGGNSSSCSFTVTVTDGQLPGITCPANITTNASAGLCSAIVNYTTPTVSDNCSGASASHVSGGVSGSSFSKGNTVVEWKATDGANNIKTCSFNITVNDTQAPVISCPANITANTTTGTCAATVNFNSATATDNCTPPPTVAQTGGALSGSSFARGVHTIAFRATDGASLSSNCTFRITVVDNVLPTISCPSNIVKNTDNNTCSSVTTYAVTGADNCTSVSVTRVSGFASGAAFPKGTNTVIWRATDLAGNSTLCSFTVTVNDVQGPTIGCPSSISTNTSPGQCNRVVNYTTPTYSDNCAGGSLSLFSGLASGSVFPTGSSTVVWRAIDNAANSTTCSFTVTVTDNEKPVVTCPPAATVAGSGSPCGFPSAQLNTATATDNCAVTSLTSNAPTTLPAGPTMITWTAGDAAGNLGTCAYTVTVNCGASPSYELGATSYDAERESTHNSFLTVPSGQALKTHNFSLSPNPSNGLFVITLSTQQNLSSHEVNPDHSSGQAPDHSSGQASNQQQIIIYDAAGRLVWQQNVAVETTRVQVDLSEGAYDAGVYWVTLRTKNTVVTKPLVLIKQ